MGGGGDTGMVVEMGVDADLDALGEWMIMGTRVRTAIATTAVSRPHHLDVNNADADDSHPLGYGADIDTDTDTLNGTVALRGLFLPPTHVIFSLRTGDAAVDAQRWRRRW
jgi:hypothetical protein